MIETTPLTFQHRYVPASAPGLAPLLLLHGTGGDENDLLGLGRAISPGAALLSPRGQVLEHGMPRFFSRLAEGVFDLDEVRRRAFDLADFITAARERYGLPAPVALGYSNGANIAAALMLLRPGVLAGAVLIRPMDILDDVGEDLATAPVLILSGASDPIVPARSAKVLAERLEAAGALVEHRILPAGHGITGNDVAAATSWLQAAGAPLASAQ